MSLLGLFLPSSILLPRKCLWHIPGSEEGILWSTVSGCVQEGRHWFPQTGPQSPHWEGRLWNPELDFVRAGVATEARVHSARISTKPESLPQAPCFPSAQLPSRDLPQRTSLLLTLLTLILSCTGWEGASPDIS